MRTLGDTEKIAIELTREKKLPVVGAAMDRKLGKKPEKRGRKPS